MNTVAVISTMHEAGYKLLESRPDLLTVRRVTDVSPEGILQGVTGVEAILVRTQLLPKDVLEKAPNLKVVARHGIGTDNIDVAYLSSRRIPVAIATDSNVTSVAEHSLMFLLALAKAFPAADAAARAGDFGWREGRHPTDVEGKSILIMGFGRIGQRLGAYCQALGMKVLAYDPYVEKSPLAGVDMVKDFREVLPQVDFVSLHMPFMPETRNLIGAAELKAMKPNAYLINAARGGIVDEDALNAALDAGEIAGAALDVFAVEPPDTSHPLFANKKVLLTPHSAAATEGAFMRMATQAAQNIIDCLEGKLQPRVIVNRKALGM
ncbi:MAG: hydroxyacid dehydrogenase [Methylobacteriaceae bacterium]|jgi:D-3-phosphoglycerate dehydrogenase|nr:hydroxyacid dehydrogenase [Methylobacteriaceae bacterium]